MLRLASKPNHKVVRGFSTSTIRFRKVVKGETQSKDSNSTLTKAEHDIVFLKNTGNANAIDIITGPLRRGSEHVLGKKDYGKDFIKHDEIIGRAFRDTVKTRKRVEYRILEPTLAEYTDGSPRLVTPVSLLNKCT